MLLDFKTPNSHANYQFLPFRGIFQFKVKASNDVHLRLCKYPSSDSKPYVEVFIGGWGNSKSVIQYNGPNHMAEAKTPGILSSTESRGFWIRLDNGILSVGRVGQKAILSWNAKLYDPDLFPLKYVGVSTGWGATGEWIIDFPQMDGLLNWIPLQHGGIVEDAIEGGEDNGEAMFVARAYEKDDLIPGKLLRSKNGILVGRGGEEIGLPEYEVLAINYPVWVPSENDSIPPLAIPGGHTSNGEKLFIGRFKIGKTFQLGKVVPSLGKCLVPYGGKEHSSEKYEILCFSNVNSSN